VTRCDAAFYQVTLDTCFISYQFMCFIFVALDSHKHHWWTGCERILQHDSTIFVFFTSCFPVGDKHCRAANNVQCASKLADQVWRYRDKMVCIDQKYCNYRKDVKIRQLLGLLLKFVVSSLHLQGIGTSTVSILFAYRGKHETCQHDHCGLWFTWITCYLHLPSMLTG